MAALRQHPRTHRLDSSGGTSRDIAAADTSSSELCRVSLGNQLNLDRKRKAASRRGGLRWTVTGFVDLMTLLRIG